MNLRPLSAEEKPSVLFRVEWHANTSFDDKGYLRSRRARRVQREIYPLAPARQEFDDHLSWQRTPTRFLSFSSSWARTMRRRKGLEDAGREGIVVIAVWANDLAGVYSAEEAASRLGYLDAGTDHRRKLRHHYEEYLVDEGIAANEYRILALFKGGGEDRDVDFECRFYTTSTRIPEGFFPRKRPNNALEDIEDEIYKNTGVRNDMKRDELVKAIAGNCNAIPKLRYN